MSRAVPPGRLFHGGHPGLLVGDLLLPPATTGAAAYEHESVKRDRIYATGDLPVAAALAARPRADIGRRYGAVYEVEPVGGVERDPYTDNDYWTGQVFACSVAGARIVGEPSGSWMTPAARVVRVIATDVRLSGLGHDAFLEAGDLVAELCTLQERDPARFVQVMVAMDAHRGDGRLRSLLAGVFGWPAQLEPSGLGDPDGWHPCRPQHRHWGVCGGAELRWIPGSVGSPMTGRRCRTVPLAASA